MQRTTSFPQQNESKTTINFRNRTFDDFDFLALRSLFNGVFVLLDELGVLVVRFYLSLGTRNATVEDAA